MSENQTKLSEFVSPSTEKNSVVEKVELVNGKVLTFNKTSTIIDEDFGAVDVEYHPDIVMNTISELAREDSLRAKPLGGWLIKSQTSKTAPNTGGLGSYQETLNDIAQKVRCEPYNIGELETALKTVLIKGVSGNMIYKHSFSPYFVSGNVKNWSQNAGGLKAFKVEARRLKNVVRNAIVINSGGD